jgi:GxxExxY protein
MDKPLRHQGTKDFGLRPLPPDLGPLSRVIVDAAFKVHNILGPGLLESVYEQCLCHEFKRRGIPFQSQLSLPVFYDGVSIETGLRIDLIVDGRIIIELKAAEVMHPIYTAQLLTYLKLTHLRLGLLINFNVPLIRDGIRRIVL